MARFMSLAWTVLCVRSMNPIHLILLVALLGCSHDAQRQNPLDSSLSTPATLQASVDETSGIAQLAWSGYRLHGEFSHWLVLRQLEGRIQVDTLGQIDHLQVQSFSDTSRSLGEDYVYRVSAVNKAGLEVSSAPLRIVSAGLPPIRLLALQFDSHAGSAAVEWSPYEGPRFSGYQLWRSTADAPPLVLELSDNTTTTYLDTTIDGGQRYAYWVVATTQDGESVRSDTLAGEIHEQVTAWPLDVDPMRDFVRLYVTDSGTIEALITTRDQVALKEFSSAGEELSHTTLFEFDDLFVRLAAVDPSYGDHPLPDLEPRASMMSVDPLDGSRHLSVGTGGAIALLHYGTDGVLIPSRSTPFAGRSLQVDFDAHEIDQVRLWSVSNRLNMRAQAFDNIEVAAGAGSFAHDFSAGEADWGRTLEPSGGVVRNYVIQSLVFAIFSAAFTDAFVSARTDTGWAGARVEVDVVSDGTGSPGVSIGPTDLADDSAGLFFQTFHPDARFLRLGLDEIEDVLRLESFSRGARIDSALVPWVALPNVSYRLGLELAIDEISVEQPFVWTGNRDRAAQWAGLVHTGRDIGVFTNRRGISVDPEGGNERDTDGISLFSDVRRILIEDDPFVIATMPEERVVEVQRLRRSSVTGILWPTPGTGITLGGVGSAPSDLTMPISAAASPDGRYYVLDAGSAQVQSYAADGSYITSFGSRGSADGQFELGDGFETTDFSGSIVVDDDGFIYVADMGNRRIQKFAP